MTEQNYPAGPAMVKIDGTRVRAIREQKGLTQLYVATVVEVTTDTVSRWENKRYPTIKKENGLKLAEALEVDLSEILDSAEDEASQENDASESVVKRHPPPATDSDEGTSTSASWYKKPGHLSIFIAIAALQIDADQRFQPAVRCGKSLNSGLVQSLRLVQIPRL